MLHAQRCSRPRKNCYPVRFNRIATWNVEGLRGNSTVKLQELREFMSLRGIGILCLQETHLPNATIFEEDRFQFFLSGTINDDSRTFAGVHSLLN